MKTKTTSSIQDEFQAAITECSPVFQNFKNQLNQISENIKAAEKLLQENNVCISYVSYMNETSRHEPGWGPFDKKTFHLAWKKDASGSFRLMYLECAWDLPDSSQIVEMLHWQGEDLPVVFQAPFIETKTDVRLKNFPYLQVFLKGFADNLTRNPLEDIIKIKEYLAVMVAKVEK